MFLVSRRNRFFLLKHKSEQKKVATLEHVDPLQCLGAGI